MLTREKVVALTAAVVTTLAETDGGPESAIYMALGVTMDQWRGLKRLLVASDLVTSLCGAMELTPKGRQLAADIEGLGIPTAI